MRAVAYSKGREKANAVQTLKLNALNGCFKSIFSLIPSDMLNAVRDGTGVFSTYCLRLEGYL